MGNNSLASDENTKIAIWQNRIAPDHRYHYKTHLAEKMSLPCKDKITELRGPHEFAIDRLRVSQGNSRTTLINYAKWFKSGKLKFSPRRVLAPYTERSEFIAYIFEDILALNKEELKSIRDVIDKLLVE